MKKREEMAAMIDYDLELEDPTVTNANLKNKPGPKKGKPRSRAQPKKGNDKTVSFVYFIIQIILKIFSIVT